MLRDVLLSLAHADLYTARWTQEIKREWTAALLMTKPEHERGIRNAALQMRIAIPDCLVVDYEPLIDTLNLPDPNDRHVLTAAICGNADAIVNNNTKIFPSKIFDKFDIKLQTPDQFVLEQAMLHTPRALGAIKKMSMRYEWPEMSAADMTNLF